MDKKEKPEASKTEANKAEASKVKPKHSETVLNKSGWPTQPAGAGIKRASSVHDRKPGARGSARGR